MLTPEERERQEELLNKDQLTEEEQNELTALQSKEPEDPDQDAFDSAWDEEGESEEGEDPSDDQDDDEQDDSQPNDTGDDDEDGAPEQDEDDEDGSSDDTDSTDDDNLPADDVDTLKQQVADLKAKNDQLTQKMKSWEGRINAANQRAAEAEEKLKQAQGQGQKSDDDGTSPDESEDDDVLSAFIEEFPDLEKPIKAMVKKLAGKVVDARLGNIQQDVNTVKQSYEEDANAKHIAAITEAHSDWEDIFGSGQLQSWIDEQPTFLQATYERIISDGSTEEIIEMFDQYKKASGQGKTENNPSTNHQERTNKNRAKAKKLEAVPATATTPPRGQKKVNPDDFDGAWDEALSKKD